MNPTYENLNCSKYALLLHGSLPNFIPIRLGPTTNDHHKTLFTSAPIQEPLKFFLSASFKGSILLNWGPISKKKSRSSKALPS